MLRGVNLRCPRLGLARSLLLGLGFPAEVHPWREAVRVCVRMTHSWSLAREHEGLPEGSSSFATIDHGLVDPYPVSAVYVVILPLSRVPLSSPKRGSGTARGVRGRGRDRGVGLPSEERVSPRSLSFSACVS